MSAVEITLTPLDLEEVIADLATKNIRQETDIHLLKESLTNALREVIRLRRKYEGSTK